MDLTLFSVFTAGFLAFLAPCVLPIVPAYLSFIAGVEGGSNESDVKRNTMKTLVPICFFVLGFSVVFIIMGATATALGRFLVDYQQYINRIGGALVIFFGLHFTNLFLREDFIKIFAGAGLLIAGAFAFDLINQQDFITIIGAWAVVFALYFFSVHLLLYRQLKAQNNTRASMFSSFVVGLTFGAGWSPCIGPILGSVLMLASRQDTVYRGMLFLAVFSLGLGIPFIIAGAFWVRFLNFVRKFGKFFAVVELVGGILLISLGLLLLTGKLAMISAW